MEDSAKPILDDGMDRNATPFDGVDSATTPGTEYSPPESPLPKRLIPKDSRAAAREKLSTLNLQEKVAQPQVQVHSPHGRLTGPGFPSDRSRLLADKVDSHKGNPGHKNQRWAERRPGWHIRRRNKGWPSPTRVRSGPVLTPDQAALFPCGISLAATWNKKLLYEVGQHLGDETKARSANVLLAPTVCMHRHPLGGRNFESFSEDPLLTGKLASQYIQGIQSKGVAATIKRA